MTEKRLRGGSHTQVEAASNISSPEERPVLKVYAPEPAQELGRTTDPVSVEVRAFPGRARPTSSQKIPLPPAEVAGYQVFRRICDRLVEELKRIDDYLIEDAIGDEGLEVIVEVEQILEELYDCQWGEGESLKRVVVAIQSQVNNVNWTRQHVAFLKEVARFLRVRYLVNAAAVQECYELMKLRDWIPFAELYRNRR